MILPAETREFLRAPAKHRINTKASESTVLPACGKGSLWEATIRTQS